MWLGSALEMERDARFGQLQCFVHLIRMPPGPGTLWSFSHIQLGRDPGVEPELTGGTLYLTIYLIWLGNTLDTPGEAGKCCPA